jgi:competence protein ComEA
MVKRVETTRVRLGWLYLSMMLAGFWLITMVTGAYAQTQKPMIDLNTASEKELEAIKGVGPATAKKIVAGRPYGSVDDLAKAGVPAKTIEGMKPLVTVGKPAAAQAAPAEKKTTTPPAAAKPETPPAPAKAAAPAASKGAVPEPPSKVSAPPAPSAAPAPSAVAPQKSPAKASGPAPAKLAPGQKVNINTATKEQLDALPEIGPVKAQAIIDGRPYKKTDDIMKVKGIKQGTFNKIKDAITVE